MLLLDLVLMIVCGAFMLKGRNWARRVLVVWYGLNVIRNTIAHPQYAVGALLFGVAVFFLFRSPASSFFHQGEAERLQIPNLKD